MLSDYEKSSDVVPDVTYSIVLTEDALPKHPCGYSSVYTDSLFGIFEKDGKELRRFSVAKNGGCDYVYLTKSDVCKNSYTLTMSHRCGELMKDSYRFINMFSIENILLEKNGIMLHSVVMSHKGKAVLLSAPSGTGKTTHSRIWQRLYGAEILNGDKALIRKQNGIYYAYGSPYTGSSGLNINKGEPIAAIAVLRQSKTNSITELTPRQAYSAIYGETTVNVWSEHFVSKVSDTVFDIASSVPTVQLNCNMENEAAEILHRHIFHS